MSDYENVMAGGPNAALQRQVNAFRAGRAEGAGTSSTRGAAATISASGSPAWDSVRERLAAMSPGAKALAARQAEILTVAGQGLVGRPYEERKQILAHMAPHLAAVGVGRSDGAGAVSGFDPTDANLAQAIGEAVILRGMLGDPPAPNGIPGPAAPSLGAPAPSPEANAG